MGRIGNDGESRRDNDTRTKPPKSTPAPAATDTSGRGRGTPDPVLPSNAASPATGIMDWPVTGTNALGGGWNRSYGTSSYNAGTSISNALARAATIRQQAKAARQTYLSGVGGVPSGSHGNIDLRSQYGIPKTPDGLKNWYDDYRTGNSTASPSAAPATNANTGATARTGGQKRPTVGADGAVSWSQSATPATPAAPAPATPATPAGSGIVSRAKPAFTRGTIPAAPSYDQSDYADFISRAYSFIDQYRG